MNIADFVTRFTYPAVYDYSLSANGRGFVVPGQPPAASLSPDEPVRYIALLKSEEGQPRGNHVHRTKVETIIVLSGSLKCEFRLSEDENVRDEFVLRAGDAVRVLPGCIHTYTAIGGGANAIELSPQALDLTDQINMGKSQS
ncbi:hypothetical protein CSA80_04765 [Candidatus Saccharibacteria bacterium]|nr:MAG: hypothetical protein CSA80_04765 [Candidatus Saccharibacteria bacterium]